MLCFRSRSVFVVVAKLLAEPVHVGVDDNVNEHVNKRVSLILVNYVTNCLSVLVVISIDLTFDLRLHFDVRLHFDLDVR